VRLPVARKTPAADGVLTLTLEHPEGRRLPSWSPGAHPDLVPGNGMTRQFPLGGDRSGAFRYRADVLREPAGRGGPAYIHDVLQAGDLAGPGGPRNNFPLVPSPAEEITMPGYIPAAPVPEPAAAQFAAATQTPPFPAAAHPRAANTA
jgi:ferredoxin-NADP reductase